MKPLFVPEDFPHDHTTPNQVSMLSPFQAAKLANARLEQWLKDAPEMIGTADPSLGWFRKARIAAIESINDKPIQFQARLVCIEEINK